MDAPRLPQDKKPRVIPPTLQDVGSPGQIIVTSPSDWEETFLLRFPTKRVARLRQVDFTFYAMHHSIPDDLLPEVQKHFQALGRALAGKMSADALEAYANFEAPDAKEFFKNLAEQREFMEDYAVLAFVDPVLVFDEDLTDPATQVPVSKLAIEELMFTWEWMWRPILALRIFCAEQAESMEFVSRSKGLRKASASSNKSRRDVSKDDGSKKPGAE